MKNLVDLVNKHVCSHTDFYDMHTLLLRNRLWTNEVENYLIISTYNSCKASAITPPNRRVSRETLRWQLNEVVCEDYFNLNNLMLFDVIVTATRFSAA